MSSSPGRSRRALPLLVLSGCCLFTAGCTGDASPAPSSPTVSSASTSSGGASSNPTSTEPSTQTPTERGTTTELTKEEAAKRYVEIVTPLNTAVLELRTLLGGTAKVSEFHSACSAATSANEAFIADLRATHWPRTVADDVDDVVKEATTRNEAFAKCAVATTAEGVVAALKNANSVGRASRTLRAHLGLPASQ